MKRATAWDPDLLEIAARLVKPKHCVWDIGTNVGLFSKAAAFHAGGQGRVLSVEADLDAVALLYRTSRYRLMDHAEMTVLRVALGAAVGFVRFSIAKRARAANSIEGFGSTQQGGVAEVRTLPCMTLDTMLMDFPAPQVLKIDAEGAELGVLEGGKQLLTQSRPAIYCEVSRHASVEVTRLLKAHSYRLWDGHRFEGSLRPEILIATYNTVALPEERVGDYASSNA